MRRDSPPPPPHRYQPADTRPVDMCPTAALDNRDIYQCRLQAASWGRYRLPGAPSAPIRRVHPHNGISFGVWGWWRTDPSYRHLISLPTLLDFLLFIFISSQSTGLHLLHVPQIYLTAYHFCKHWWRRSKKNHDIDENSYRLVDSSYNMTNQWVIMLGNLT